MYKADEGSNLRTVFCVNEGLGYSSEEVHVWQRKRGKSDQPAVHLCRFLIQNQHLVSLQHDNVFVDYFRGMLTFVSN